MKYTPKIGMEVHIQPKTNSKMFCACANEFNVSEPNKNICEICTGQPGTMPYINEAAVAATIKAGLALNCSINSLVHWDRKHYFYPDLPKGYQITQNDMPIAIKGRLEFEYADEQGAIQSKSVRINRLHLEEDAGKDVHPKGVQYSLIDYNRAGAPLIELVTEPDIENKEQAAAFCRHLQQIFRYIRVSDADMEKGQMRCEVNISLGANGKDGTKVEVKNINSFKGVTRSIEYEIARQKELLDRGEKVKQETRGWNADKQKTISQRSKEEAQDYRYFPEPDLPPVHITEEWKNVIAKSIPELPGQKKQRFIDEYKIPEEQAGVLTLDVDVANFFDAVCSEICGWEEAKSSRVNPEEAAKRELKAIKLAANYITTELTRMAAKNGLAFRDIKITAENFAELMSIIERKEINSSSAQVVLAEMFATGGDPSQIIAAKNLGLVQDENFVESAVNEVLDGNQKAIADYRGGKEQALQFLVGQVMAKTKGKVDPGTAREMISKKISQP